jgi:molybdate transport system substrate-binding protein
VRRRAAAALAAGLLVLAGCASGGPERTDIVVFAAASLTEAFGEIGRAFEQGNEGIAVRFNFGPSDGLATQITEGGPADVFASASPRWMDAVAADPGVTDRAVFARNRLVVLVPASNPARIGGLADLARPGVKLVLAAAGVPAGRYAREALAKAGIAVRAMRNLVSNEEDVKGVVQKVLLDEADAGVVYASDATPSAHGRVRAIAIPAARNVIATYSIAVVRRSGLPPAARAFVRFVLGAGQKALARHGFLPRG